MVVSCDAAASEVILALGLTSATPLATACRLGCLRSWLEWHYPYQLFLLGGELGDDPPSPCRCWAGAEPRAARVLSRVHSLDIGHGTADGERRGHQVAPSRRWRSEPPMALSRSFAAATALGTDLYILGGQRLRHGLGRCRSWCPVRAVEHYDAERQVWQMLPPMPTARKGLAAAAAGGFLYAVGGSNCCHDLKTAERYHLQTQRWEVLPSLSLPRENLALMKTAEGNILAMGPEVPSASSIEMFEPLLWCWTELKRSLPAALAWPGERSLPWPSQRHCSACATLAGQMYICGGYQDFKACRRVDILDLRENVARPGPILPTPCAGAAMAFLRPRREVF